MANPTMTLIASHTTPSGGETSFTFSSIPQTYTDLKIIASPRVTTGNWITISFNGTSISTNSKIIFIQGNGSSTPSSSSDTTTQYGLLGDAPTDTANTFGNNELYIPNYTSSNYKSFSEDLVEENNGTTAYLMLTAGLWSNTAAITSITLAALTGNIAQYSTFYLYGIRNS